jgi:hypothetical protein
VQTANCFHIQLGWDVPEVTQQIEDQDIEPDVSEKSAFFFTELN